MLVLSQQKYFVATNIILCFRPWTQYSRHCEALRAHLEMRRSTSGSQNNNDIMTSPTSCFLSGCETSCDVMNEFWRFVPTLKKQRWRKLTFSVGWIHLRDTFFFFFFFLRNCINSTNSSREKITPKTLPSSLMELDGNVARAWLEVLQKNEALSKD